MNLLLFAVFCPHTLHSFGLGGFIEINIFRVRWDAVVVSANEQMFWWPAAAMGARGASLARAGRIAASAIHILFYYSRLAPADNDQLPHGMKRLSTNTPSLS